MRHDQRAILDIAYDSSARSHIDIVADLYRGNQLGIASDHAAIADLRLMLVVAVVIHGDNAAPDVGLTSYNRVAQVAQMTRFGAAADARLLGLDEIANTILTL